MTFLHLKKNGSNLEKWIKSGKMDQIWENGSDIGIKWIKLGKMDQIGKIDQVEKMDEVWKNG